MTLDLKQLENKARFVEEVCRGDLVVSNRKRSKILGDLKECGYDLFPKDVEDADTDQDSDDEDNEATEETPSDAELAKGYEYLLGMKIWSLTFERAEELRRQRTEKAKEVDDLEATSPEALWLADLDAIEELLDERDKVTGIESKTQKQKAKISKILSRKKQHDEVSNATLSIMSHEDTIDPHLNLYLVQWLRSGIRSWRSRNLRNLTQIQTHLRMIFLMRLSQQSLCQKLGL